MAIYTCGGSWLGWDWENIPECKQHQFPGQGMLNHMCGESELDPGAHALIPTLCSDGGYHATSTSG